MKKLSEVTRRDIIDIILNGFVVTEFISKPHPDFRHYTEPEDFEYKIHYYGRIGEINFLKRLYKLNEMPSTDSRHKDAEGDIVRHTIMNDDYLYGWVFEDSRFGLSQGNDDEIFLNFLSEMFHPVVRDEKGDWKQVLEKLNELLKYDGYEIFPQDHISGRKIYGWREISSGNRVIEGQIESIKVAFDTDYVRKQVDLMYELIDTAPDSAIGKAKELLEICCKTILEECNVEYSQELDLNQLMRLTCESIDLSPKKLKGDVKGKDIAARILGNFSNIAQGMAELRNLYGDGHGKHKDFQALPARYAHLAAGASAAAVKFMWDTYLERIKPKDQ